MTNILHLRARGVTLSLDPSLELGAGGEARVFALPGDAERVAKIYRHPSPERARKIARMIAHPPLLGPDPEGAVRLAWPQEGVVDEEGRPVGFLMPRAEGPRIFEFYNPVTRRAQAPLFHYGLLHRAGTNLAAAFAALHARGYLVGDVNESNILVAPEGSVTLVDTDSFQVPDAAGVFRSGVGRPEFTPPELQGMAFAAVDRTAAHDRFGLGVLLFLLLMEGTHPFAVRVGAGSAEPLPLEGRIRAGMFPYAGSRPARAGCLPPRLALPFGVVHPAVRELFERCFVDGHLDPAARPAAPEWRDALAAAEAELRRCDLNPQHRFGTHLGECPWCERTRLLRGRDPFPATAAAARLAPARARRAPAATPAPVPAAAAVPVQQRPRSRAVRQPRSPAQALGALRRTVADPAVWVFPFLLLAILPLGVGQLVAAVAALALGLFALQPRRTPRDWGRLVTMTFALTILFGLAADRVRAPDDIPPPIYDEPSPPPPITGQNGESTYDISTVTEAPRLQNRAAVARALERAYPPLMRDAGVGGTALLSFRIDAEGYVNAESIEVLESSNEQFSNASIAVVERMRFEPARVHGRRVPVRVQIPITFQPQL
ncbi:MAG TPA: TonB family protein [Longimicrobium sp.]|jgi:TonB family protein